MEILSLLYITRNFDTRLNAIYLRLECAHAEAYYLRSRTYLELISDIVTGSYDKVGVSGELTNRLRDHRGTTAP